MATIIKESGTEFNRIMDAYKKHFVENQMLSFMNLMWQFIMNRVHSEKELIFHPVDSPSSDGFMIGRVHNNQAGYIETGTLFLPELPYDECCDICDELNMELFGIGETEANKIISLSMSLPGGMKEYQY